jgi:GntR family transcriptional regulator, transcriptional repressor for pyruvate dehydrogenase complex
MTRTPLVQQVTQTLARRISTMDEQNPMLPSERQLALETGVSRPVLREAIRNLQMQGLVEVRHGIGVRAINKPHQPLIGAFDRVTDKQKSRLDQFAEARLLIEPQVARLAASRATQALVKSLRANIRAHAAAPDIARAVELDLAFHRLVASAAQNQILITVLDALADLGRQTRSLSMQAFGLSYAVASAIAHHTAITDAIADKNTDAAESLMRAHLQGAQKDFQKSTASSKQENK